MPLNPRWRWKLERWRDSVTKIFRSEPVQARPRICPACGKLAGATATKCPECGASLTFSLAAASRSLSGLLPATAPATYAILGLCCLLYVVSFLLTMRLGSGLAPTGRGLGSLFSLGNISAGVLQALGASLPLGYDLIQPWRLVTAVFLHGGLIHIGFNMWVLIDIGPVVEELYGSARYLFLYLVTGIFGYVVSGLLGHFSIGASGALMGLIGLMLAVTTRRGGASMQMLRGQLIFWVAGIFFLGFMSPGIDNAAHFGGLAAGFLLGRVLADREPASPEERKRAYALGWLAGLAIVASFAAMIARFFARS